MHQKPAPPIAELYPGLTETELAAARENLERYLALVLRIFDRVELDEDPQPDRLTPGIGTLACTPPRSESSN